MTKVSNHLIESASENYPLPNPSVWTTPHVSLSLSTNEINPPNYNEHIAPSVSELDDLPPNYYDISIIPNGAVQHYNEVVPYTEASKVKIERKDQGVLSFDPLLDRNPDQLWLYFMTYLNEKPSLIIKICGYHIEYYTTSESYRQPNGRYSTRTVTRSRQVADFNYSIDVASYISPQWSRVAVIPSKKAITNGEILSFRDTVEQYTRSEKQIKEIRCQKQVINWNYRELKDKIRILVSTTGYQHTICIGFSLDNHNISARSSSKLSRFSNSIWTRILCVITCLCLIFAPIYCCLRAAGRVRDQIVADYEMILSADAFLHMNSGLIVNAVMSRSHQRFLANIT